MSSDIPAQLSAIKAELLGGGNSKAWSTLWVIGAIEFTALIARSADIAYLALGAMRDPNLRGIAPSILRNLNHMVEGEEKGVIAALMPFMTQRSDATNALICAISAYVTVLCELDEESIVMREAYDAIICVKRPASKRVLGWLQVESERRGLAWPPPSVERDYASLCEELADY